MRDGSMLLLQCEASGALDMSERRAHLIVVLVLLAIAAWIVWHRVDEPQRFNRCAYAESC